MNCKEFLSLQSEYIDGCLDESTAAEVRAHLAVCPACRRTHAEMTALVKTLHEMDDIAVPDTLADKVLAAVAPKKPRVFALPRVLRSWQTYSLAACLILAVVLYTQTYDRYKMTTTENIRYTAPSPAASAQPEDAVDYTAEMGDNAETAETTETVETAENRKTSPAADMAAPTELPTPRTEKLPHMEQATETTAEAVTAEEASMKNVAAEDAAVENASVENAAAGEVTAKETAEAVTADAEAEAIPEESAPAAYRARTAPAGGAASSSSSATEDAEESLAGAPMMTFADSAEETDAVAAYPPADSLWQGTVTFITADERAEAVFAEAEAGGPDAVEAAFHAAGIAFSAETGKGADYTVKYNDLAAEANALAARIADGETGLDAALARIKTDLQNIMDRCNTIAVYLIIE